MEELRFNNDWWPNKDDYLGLVICATISAAYCAFILLMLR